LEESDTDKKEKVIKIKYTNWRGETSIRTIIVRDAWFGKTKWHTKEQWLIHAYDIDKKTERDFALLDIQEIINS